jgi:phage terminase large subunit-like protein
MLATAATATRLKLPSFHPRQAEIAMHPARFRVAAAGRRFGKTRLGAALCVKTAADGGRAWWVAPTYPVAMVGWRLIRRLALQVPGAEVRQSERLVSFPNGGEIQVRSADNPDSLRGEGLDFVVFDECAFIHEDAWQEAVRPALADRRGRALFISTPKGRNWFWRLWQRCIDDHDHEWHGWQLPTAANPYIAPSEIEAARLGLPERIFSQEFLAQFLDDAGGVFRRVMEAATATAQGGAIGGHEYAFGVDWGRTGDFTAVAVLDVTHSEIVALDRFNQIDYSLQLARLTALYERFRPRAIVAEANSMGQPLIEQLQAAGLPVVPFTTTAASKQIAVDALALAFERGALRIIPDPTLIAELQAYEAERLPSGMLRYGAPSGMHDDTVMALMLAWHNPAPATAGVTSYAQRSFSTPQRPRR